MEKVYQVKFMNSEDDSINIRDKQGDLIDSIYIGKEPFLVVESELKKYYKLGGGIKTLKFVGNTNLLKKENKANSKNKNEAEKKKIRKMTASEKANYLNKEAWAKREIQDALNNKKYPYNAKIYRHIKSCYKSALKVYKSLISDNPNKSSLLLTQDILNRLINEKPFSPIKDTKKEWNIISQKDNKITYQSSRMSSLLKIVTMNDSNNPEIKYIDTNACYCVFEKCDGLYTDDFINEIYSEMFPITMPYMPPTEFATAFCKKSLTELGNGGFDTIAFLYVKTPSGEKIEVNRYFKKVNADDEIKWVEIGLEEYNQRVNMENERINGRINEITKHINSTIKK